MKKLNVLKTIIDFIWIMSLIFYPLIVLFTVILLFNKDLIDIPITFTGVTVDLNTGLGKVAFVINVLNFGVLLYALFYFRKLLTHFMQRLIFEDTTCRLLNKIGTIVMFSSVLYLASDFIADVAKSNIGIEFGYGPFLYLVALGLFFKVLSEVFTLAKTMKEENELTI